MNEPNNYRVVTPSKFEERIVFFFVCMGVITVTYGIFFIIDFLPEKPSETPQENTVEIAQEIVPPSEAPVVEAVVIDPFPTRIIFDTLDKEILISNPESDSVALLDEALLKGVVRHPDSADFKEIGTIFLLGHSSYLPVVHNKNFQAFNGIQKLKWGDTLRLQSSDMEYVYTVDRVYEAKATDAEVEIQLGIPKLILATCDSFGTKDDRFIVEATLTESRALVAS